MLRVVAAVAALAVGATAVWPRMQPASIAQAGHEGVRRRGKGPGAMSKGDAPFELPKVQASLKTIRGNGHQGQGLFGDDTKTGETDALPAAFEKKADLFARFDKLAADAKAAEGAIKDEASFKAEWPKVVSNCGGCHKEYRKPPAAK